jgi:RES domain-containing protein
MRRAWRVVKRRHADEAFNGEGAREYGGRWNSPGKRVVYASETTALALLEVLVHIDASVLDNYTAIPITFDESMVTTVDVSVLPKGWNRYPCGMETRTAGDAWLQSAVSPALMVPSVIVPHEWNFLISPEHPEFRRMTIGEPVDFDIDLRLLRP